MNAFIFMKDLLYIYIHLCWNGCAADNGYAYLHI